MPQLHPRFFRTFAPLLLACALLQACASNKAAQQSQQPQPQTIHLRSDASVSNPQAGTQLLKKDLFNIVMGPKTLSVNGTPIKNLAELEHLLRSYEQPALTLATHKCLSTEKAAEALSLAQRYTDTPIAFGSYGDFDDPECK